MSGRIHFSSLRLLVVGAALWAPTMCMAGKHFTMPAPKPAKTYPAHDDHVDEAVALALDPYDTADKAAIFSVRYSDLGFMPVFVIITNDGGQPVSLAGTRVQLITADRTKIPPATEDDIYRRLARPTGAGPSPNPLPWPKKVKTSVSKEEQEEIQNSMFAARAVEPHSTQAGFMFFDVAGISAPLAGANLYLTGATDAKGHELMYFEVPLEKYLNASQTPK